MTNPMTDTQAGLLPCPFCGRDPEKVNYTDRTIVWCVSPACSVQPRAVSHICETHADQLWNTRPSPPASAEVVAQHIEKIARRAKEIVELPEGEDKSKAAEAIIGTFAQIGIGWADFMRLQAGAAVQVPDDVARLVIAARNVAYDTPALESPRGDYLADWNARIKELDQAAEAFSERVPYDDEPPEEEIAAAPQKQGA